VIYYRRISHPCHAFQIRGKEFFFVHIFSAFIIIIQPEIRKRFSISEGSIPANKALRAYCVAVGRIAQKTSSLPL